MVDASSASRLGAVAVGLGIAMAAGAGSASAAPTDSTAPSESTSTSSESRKSEKEAKSSQTDSTDTSESVRKRNPGDRWTAHDSQDSSDDSEGSSDTPDQDSDTSDSRSDTAESSDQPDAADESDNSNDSAGGTESTGEESPEPDTDKTATDPTEEVAQTPDNGTDPTPATPEEAVPDEQVKTAPTQAAVTAVAATGGSSQSPAEPTDPRGILGWVTSLSSAVQREVDYFINGGSAPTTAPTQLSVSQGNGSVLGTVNAVGNPRDTLTYSVITAPTAGTVTIGPNGVYVYTPTSFTTEDLADSFTVAIRNTGLNLRSLMAVFNPSLNTTMVNVGVNVAGMDIPEESNNTTRGFNVTNWTQYDLRLTHADGQGNFDGPVPINSVLKPGETQHFEIILSFLHTDTGVVYYESVVPGGTNASISMTIEAAAFDYVDMTCPTNNCWIPGSAHAYILETPDTVVEVRADRPDLQSAILDQLCYSGSAATCSFKGTERVESFAPQQVVVTLRNPADGVFPYTQTLKTTISEKHSVTLSAKVAVNVLSIVNEEITGQWGQEWSKTHEYTETFKPVVSAWSVGTVYAASPIIRYTGDFTIQLGNTTWLLRNVDFDKPDPSGGRHSIWAYSEVPIPHTADGTATTSV